MASIYNVCRIEWYIYMSIYSISIHCMTLHVRIGINQGSSNLLTVSLFVKTKQNYSIANLIAKKHEFKIELAKLPLKHLILKKAEINII